MDFHYSFFLLSILLFLSLHATADGTGSVFFLDSSIHQYFRPPSSDSVSETDSMLLSEVGAAVSVLLGFAPPAMLSAAGSSRLNEVLMPNPFDRPRSVFMLDVRGAEDSQVMVQSGNAWFGSALRSRVLMESNKADIQLPDEDEVSVVSLNEPLSFGSDVELTDKELSDFASWLGGTYVANALKPMNGELTIPLASGARLNLHMSKKAEREFIMSLVSLISNIQRAMEMHQDLSGSMRNPAELITGSFDGIKVLQEEYGTEGVAEEGQELFFTSISKIFDSLQAVYRGQIVGVILCNGTPLPESETMLNVMITSRPSGRWLEETTGASNSTTIAEIVLVRRTLAWITGIILVIATLLGDHKILMSGQMEGICLIITFTIEAFTNSFDRIHNIWMGFLMCITDKPNQTLSLIIWGQLHESFFSTQPIQSRIQFIRDPSSFLRVDCRLPKTQPSTFIQAWDRRSC